MNADEIFKLGQKLMDIRIDAEMLREDLAKCSDEEFVQRAQGIEGYSLFAAGEAERLAKELHELRISITERAAEMQGINLEPPPAPPPSLSDSDNFANSDGGSDDADIDDEDEEEEE